MKRLLSLLTAASLIFALPCAAAFAANTEKYNFGSEEIVIADTEDVFVQITDIGYEEYSNEYTYEFAIVNRSNNPIEYGTDYACVNGYVVGSYMFGTIAAGRRAITYLEILKDDVDRLQMNRVDELTFRFYVNEWIGDEMQEVFSDTVTLYPGGADPDEVFSPAPEDFYPELVFENEFIRFRIIDAKQVDGSPFYAVSCILENPNSFDITAECTNFLVDGIPTDPFWLCRIPAGCRILSDIYIDEEAFSPADFFEPDQISFTLALTEGWKDYTEDAPDTAPFFAYPLSFRPARG